ncbi:MAG: hypothetical protein ACLSD6_01075 [Clostridium sp.]
MNAPIGVFDSGIGGLTVAKEIMRQIPGKVLFILEIQPVCHMVPNQKIRFVNTVSRLLNFS